MKHLCCWHIILRQAVPFEHKNSISEDDGGELVSLDFYGSSSISIDHEFLYGQAWRLSLHRNCNGLHPAGLSCVECTGMEETSFSINRSRYPVEQRPTTMGPRTRLTEHMRTEMPTVDLSRVSSNNKTVATTLRYSYTSSRHSSLKNYMQESRRLNQRLRIVPLYMEYTPWKSYHTHH
jgi:hypothetical protein